jgi:hypothetical protein
MAVLNLLLVSVLLQLVLWVLNVLDGVTVAGVQKESTSVLVAADVLADAKKLISCLLTTDVTS